MSGKGGRRDDSYFAIARRKRNKALMIIIPVVAVAVAGAVAAGFAFSQTSPSRFGLLGSAHEHAVFAVKLDRQAFDFSQSKYQVQSSYIHVEGGDGTTLHRHATGVPFGEFLKSVRMDIKDNCFIRDDGARFCDGEDGKNLKFFVNGQQVSSITDFVLRENDRILVIYGSETDAQINQELQVLRDTPIKK